MKVYYVVECNGFQGVAHYNTYEEAAIAAQARNSLTRKKWIVRTIYLSNNRLVK